MEAKARGGVYKGEDLEDAGVWLEMRDDRATPENSSKYNDLARISELGQAIAVALTSEGLWEKLREKSPE